MTLSWQAWAAGAAVFAAMTAIFAKLGVAEIPADMATLLRTALILAAIVLATGQWVPLRAISGRGALFLVLSAAATGLSWLCYFRALKLGDAARVAPVDKLSVVLVVVFAALFLGEKVSAAHWGGVALIAAGVAVLALTP